MDATAVGRRLTGAGVRRIGQPLVNGRAFGAESIEAGIGRIAESVGRLRKGGAVTVLNVLVQTPFARAAGWALFHSLWEGVLVAAVLAAVLSVTRSPNARYIVACVAMLALLAGFTFTFAWHVPQLAPGKLVEGNQAIPARLSIDII